MAAVIGTWNPAKWAWESLAEDIQESERGQLVSVEWSVARRRKGIESGDRFYLMKQGAGARGVLASGVVRSGPFTGEHWDGSGASLQYVEVELDCVLDPRDLLGLDDLQSLAPHTHWKPQSSGSNVNALDEAALEDAWRTHVAALGRTVNT